MTFILLFTLEPSWVASAAKRLTGLAVDSEARAVAYVVVDSFYLNSLLLINLIMYLYQDYYSLNLSL